MYICACPLVCVGIIGGQKKASDFLDLELGECDPPDMGAGMN